MRKILRKFSLAACVLIAELALQIMCAEIALFVLKREHINAVSFGKIHVQ